MIELSIVVPTRNRADRLVPFFEALDRLGFDGVKSELVMVDNGSSDGTEATFLAWAAGRPGLRMVREDIPGSGAARNKGWRSAQGAIVAMLDDDCYVQPGFIESYIQIFAEHPTVGWGGGRILLHDPQDEPITIDECDHVRNYPAGRYLPCGSIHGANFAFRRSVLEQIGGFDPRTGAGTPFGCEDIDAMARASWAGWDGIFDPRPVVRHHHGRRQGSGLARLESVYADGAGAYHAKCLLSPPMRWTYLKQVAKRLVNQPWRISRREFLAGLHFWWRTARPLPVDALRTDR